MRGMGELIGTKQHGMQYAIGYEYYMELLKSEIDKLKLKN
jgi:transcription-repair coupling factor (superfamily II helicase)